MKSRIIILTVVLLLVPVLIGATPLNLAVKMGAGCPFKQGPMLERCNPTVIHSNLSPGDLVLMSYLPSSPIFNLTRVPGSRLKMVWLCLFPRCLNRFSPSLLISTAPRFFTFKIIFFVSPQSTREGKKGPLPRSQQNRMQSKGEGPFHEPGFRKYQ